MPKCDPKKLRKLPLLGCETPTKGQLRLMKKHGTPAAFAVACFECVPGWISMQEAIDAVREYLQEWSKAK